VDAFTQTSPRAVPGVDETTLERYAELLVGLGANVQADQILEIRVDLEKREFVPYLAAAAYRRGARFVDVTYFDAFVRRERILNAPEDSLEFVPQWHRDRIRQLGELRGAMISLAPGIPFGVAEDLPEARAAREPFPSLPDYLTLVSDQTVAWTVAPLPTRSWATTVRPDADPDEALARLWEDVVYMCRLDAADPVAAWRARFAELAEMTRALQGRSFDALHFEGPGTDLTVGLLPSSTWVSGPSKTVDGIQHASNLPTEETFTAPDPERAEGVATSTMPLVLKSGAIVEGLVVRFEGGRAVDVQATRGGDALRELLGRDEGGTRLGEVALVDRETRVGQLGTVFYTTLLDENASSHLALGNAYRKTIGDADAGRINRSSVHVDFMVGSDDVNVTGITDSGDRVPILNGGARVL
jgi:aminopeptidase